MCFSGWVCATEKVTFFGDRQHSVATDVIIPSIPATWWISLALVVFWEENPEHLSAGRFVKLGWLIVNSSFRSRVYTTIQGKIYYFLGGGFFQFPDVGPLSRVPMVASRICWTRITRSGSPFQRFADAFAHTWKEMQRMDWTPCLARCSAAVGWISGRRQLQQLGNHLSDLLGKLPFRLGWMNFHINFWSAQRHLQWTFEYGSYQSRSSQILGIILWRTHRE